MGGDIYHFPKIDDRRKQDTLLVSFFLCLILFSFDVSRTNGQTIFLHNGINWSKIDYENAEFDRSYISGLSIDYFEKKFFFLSSGVSVAHKGGRLYLSTFPYDEEPNYYIKTNYISFYSQFNLAYRLGKIKMYAGCGPRFDIRTNHHNVREVNNVLCGLHSTIGVNYAINNRFVLGVNTNYSPTFTHVFQNRTWKETSLAFEINIGYTFK